MRVMLLNLSRGRHGEEERGWIPVTAQHGHGTCCKQFSLPELLSFPWKVKVTVPSARAANEDPVKQSPPWLSFKMTHSLLVTCK